MPKFGDYYVVEFRIPVKVDSVNSVQEAVSFAGQICENLYGFRPDNWYARIFQYSTGDAKVGHIKEYFYNPNSSTYREITKNISYFNELSHKGLSPDNQKNPDIIIKSLLEEN